MVAVRFLIVLYFLGFEGGNEGEWSVPHPHNWRTYRSLLFWGLCLNWIGPLLTLSQNFTIHVTETCNPSQSNVSLDETSVRRVWR
jgi:hypothetical protein